MDGYRISARWNWKCLYIFHMMRNHFIFHFLGVSHQSTQPCFFIVTSYRIYRSQHFQPHLRLMDSNRDGFFQKNRTEYPRIQAVPIYGWRRAIPHGRWMCSVLFFVCVKRIKICPTPPNLGLCTNGISLFLSLMSPFYRIVSDANPVSAIGGVGLPQRPTTEGCVGESIRSTADENPGVRYQQRQWRQHPQVECYIFASFEFDGDRGFNPGQGKDAQIARAR